MVAESLRGWPAARARRIGELVDEDREPVLAARDRGRELDLWDVAEIALGEADSGSGRRVTRGS
jgi:hypothetical protein